MAQKTFTYFYSKSNESHHSALEKYRWQLQHNRTNHTTILLSNAENSCRPWKS